MNKKITLTILIGLLAVNGCSKKNTEPEYVGTSTFPLTSDSRWDYVRNYYLIPFVDSSLADTQTFAVTRRVVGPDTVIGSDQLYIVDDSTSRTDSSEADPFVDRHWYGIVDGQLREYGEVMFFPWETPSLSLFDNPRILLDFPLMPGKAWTESSEDMRSVYNTVVGIEYIPVADSQVKCDVVRSRMVDDQSGHVFYDAHRWYSNSGLIHEETDFGIEAILDSNDVVIDSVRHLRVLELIGLGDN